MLCWPPLALTGVPPGTLSGGDGAMQSGEGAITTRAYCSVTTPPTFKMLELYDIERFMSVRVSLAERGLTAADLLIPVIPLFPAEIRRSWAGFTTHICF